MKKLLRVLGRLFLALLFLAAAALVTLGLLRWRGLILLPDEADPGGWEVFGVDVSSYQGEVDWPVLAEQGVDFAFIKATEGSLLQDRRFAANWAGAAAAGVRAGRVRRGGGGGLGGLAAGAGRGARDGMGLGKSAQGGGRGAPWDSSALPLLRLLQQDALGYRCHSHSLCRSYAIDFEVEGAG